MYEKTQSEYYDVMAKKRIVEADKAKIQEAIAQLDMKKNDALNKAYVKVRGWECLDACMSKVDK